MTDTVPIPVSLIHNIGRSMVGIIDTDGQQLQCALDMLHAPTNRAKFVAFDEYLELFVERRVSFDQLCGQVNKLMEMAADNG